MWGDTIYTGSRAPRGAWEPIRDHFFSHLLQEPRHQLRSGSRITIIFLNGCALTRQQEREDRNLDNFPTNQILFLSVPSSITWVSATARLCSSKIEHLENIVTGIESPPTKSFDISGQSLTGPISVPNNSNDRLKPILENAYAPSGAETPAVCMSGWFGDVLS